MAVTPFLVSIVVTKLNATSLLCLACYWYNRVHCGVCYIHDVLAANPTRTSWRGRSVFCGFVVDKDAAAEVVQGSIIDAAYQAESIELDDGFNGVIPSAKDFHYSN
jgi:hypothetical protein